MIYHGYDVGHMSRNYGIILDEDAVDEFQRQLDIEIALSRVRSYFSKLSADELRQQDCIDYMHTL